MDDGCQDVATCLTPVIATILRRLAVKLGVDNVHVLLQIYKCVKSKYLDDQPPPVASLGVLVTGCEAVWFVEYLWHKEECNGTVTWQLKALSCCSKVCSSRLSSRTVGSDLALAVVGGQAMTHRAE